MVATNHMWLFKLIRLNIILNWVSHSHYPHFRCSVATWLPYWTVNSIGHFHLWRYSHFANVETNSEVLPIYLVKGKTRNQTQWTGFTSHPFPLYHNIISQVSRVNRLGRFKTDSLILNNLIYYYCSRTLLKTGFIH